MKFKIGDIVQFTHGSDVYGGQRAKILEIVNKPYLISLQYKFIMITGRNKDIIEIFLQDTVEKTLNAKLVQTKSYLPDWL